MFDGLFVYVCVRWL